MIKGQFSVGAASRTVVLWALACLPLAIASPSLGDVNKAYQHLYEVMDQYHQSFDVYTDLSAAGNHFVMFGRMSSVGDGGKVATDPGCETSPHSGATCIENRFTAAGFNWGGYYLMNGVLEGDETQPKANWGEYPDAGIDLSGATRLTFWARGQSGGERVEFLVFGVGRDSITGIPTEPYPDSSPKRTLGYIALSDVWTQYSIDLTGTDLSYVLGGFAWVTDAMEDGYQDIVFYLDDIRYDKSRLDAPRFLVSFQTIPSGADFDTINRNVAFVYDNALTLLALLCRGGSEDVERARLIADALVYAIDHDRAFEDGRLRNAYQAGDLALPAGWTPHGKEHTVRMPGWSDPNGSGWLEDKGHVGTHTGNVAWAILSLLTYYERAGGSQYLDAARTLGTWIETRTKDTRGAGGYKGGYEGWETTSTNPAGQTPLLWKSTEHNLDVYAAFTRLYDATGEIAWQERAQHARQFVEAMWDEAQQHFWTGTTEDGITLNKDHVPVDIQAWAVTVLGQYQSALGWCEQNCHVEVDGFTGFDFDDDKDGVWFEGTAQMALAYRIGDQADKSNDLLGQLREAQASGPNANGKGIIAASHDGVTTGFGWEYFSRLHVGATAWYAFAEMGYNPFWNTHVGGLLCDMSWDGIVSIIGDVPPFVRVVYFQDFDGYEQEFPGRDPVPPGDCNHDGILSIVGDVPCFVECVYFRNCPE
ncbi:MAG: hypothetical protein ABFE13_07270 [Phycisphaerales bacterium]